MPNRILRDWTDSYAVNELDAHEERFFVRLIMKADDFGRFHADVRLLKANLFPLLSETRDTDISHWLAACEKAGLLCCYVDARGRQFLEIQNFRQRTRQSESKFPAPDSRQPTLDNPPQDNSPPSDRQVTVKRQSIDRQLRTETETYSETETETARGNGATPFDSFDDPLAEMSKAVSTAMGLTCIPTGDDARPIHEAAAAFVTAGIAPADVGDYETDYYRRKAATGSKYPLTLKILRADLPTFVRGKVKREEANGAGQSTVIRPPIVTAPPEYRRQRKGDT